MISDSYVPSQGHSIFSYAVLFVSQITHRNTNTHTHIQAHTHKHIHTRTHIHIHIHTQTQTHTHTHTQTNEQTPSKFLSIGTGIMRTENKNLL